MSKKCYLTEKQFYIIKDLYENGESYFPEDFSQLILDNFDCETLQDELLEKGLCPYCQTELEKNKEGDWICESCHYKFK